MSRFKPKPMTEADWDRIRRRIQSVGAALDAVWDAEWEFFGPRVLNKKTKAGVAIWAMGLACENMAHGTGRTRPGWKLYSSLDAESTKPKGAPR